MTHVDYSARIQTVRRDTNPLYWDIIEAFRCRTGCAVIVNTSFNVRGEPIVCTPEDSYRCFMRTEMDALVLEDCVLLKEEQPAFDDRENWREQAERANSQSPRIGLKDVSPYQKCCHIPYTTQ